MQCCRGDCIHVGVLVTLRCGHPEVVCEDCLVKDGMERCIVCIYKKVFEEEAEKPHPFWAEA